jgi:hypothetical protein
MRRYVKFRIDTLMQISGVVPENGRKTFQRITQYAKTLEKASSPDSDVAKSQCPRFGEDRFESSRYDSPLLEVIPAMAAGNTAAILFIFSSQ